MTSHYPYPSCPHLADLKLSRVMTMAAQLWVKVFLPVDEMKPSMKIFARPSHLHAMLTGARDERAFQTEPRQLRMQGTKSVPLSF